ncbi:hypothetical protein HYX58_05220 [Candidatus Dependentiae bacterium]|nr:hypothetical protein [Candidatus Dependentiae bacterium]
MFIFILFLLLPKSICAQEASKPFDYTQHPAYSDDIFAKIVLHMPPEIVKEIILQSFADSDQKEKKYLSEKIGTIDQLKAADGKIKEYYNVYAAAFRKRHNFEPFLTNDSKIEDPQNGGLIDVYKPTYEGLKTISTCHIPSIARKRNEWSYQTALGLTLNEKRDKDVVSEEKCGDRTNHNRLAAAYKKGCKPPLNKSWGASLKKSAPDKFISYFFGDVKDYIYLGKADHSDSLVSTWRIEMPHKLISVLDNMYYLYPIDSDPIPIAHIDSDTLFSLTPNGEPVIKKLAENEYVSLGEANDILLFKDGYSELSLIDMSGKRCEEKIPLPPECSIKSAAFIPHTSRIVAIECYEDTKKYYLNTITKQLYQSARWAEKFPSTYVYPHLEQWDKHFKPEFYFVQVPMIAANIKKIKELERQSSTGIWTTNHQCKLLDALKEFTQLGHSYQREILWLTSPNSSRPSYANNPYAKLYKERCSSIPIKKIKEKDLALEIAPAQGTDIIFADILSSFMSNNSN